MTEDPATIDPTSVALLVMDYQTGILGRFDDADGLVARAAAAIAVVRRHGASVGYVRVAFDDADIAAMPPGTHMASRVSQAAGAFHKDSPATAIDARLTPQPGDVIVCKTRVGPFLTTDLDEQLRARGITTLLLAGLSTSGVVLSTVRDAADRDYRLIVLADACADPDGEVHAFLTERIFPRQARVITTGQLEALFEGAA